MDAFPAAYFGEVLAEQCEASAHISVFLMAQASALRSNCSEHEAARKGMLALRDSVLNDPNIKGKRARILSRAFEDLVAR